MPSPVTAPPSVIVFSWNHQRRQPGTQGRVDEVPVGAHAGDVGRAGIRVDCDDIGEPGGVQAGASRLARARKRFDVGFGQAHRGVRRYGAVAGEEPLDAVGVRGPGCGIGAHDYASPRRSRCDRTGCSPATMMGSCQRMGPGQRGQHDPDRRRTCEGARRGRRLPGRPAQDSVAAVQRVPGAAGRPRPGTVAKWKLQATVAGARCRPTSIRGSHRHREGRQLLDGDHRPSPRPGWFQRHRQDPWNGADGVKGSSRRRSLRWLRRIQDEVLANPEERGRAELAQEVRRLRRQNGRDALTTASACTSADLPGVSISAESAGFSCCPVRPGSTVLRHSAPARSGGPSSPTRCSSPPGFLARPVGRAWSANWMDGPAWAVFRFGGWGRG